MGNVGMVGKIRVLERADGIVRFRYVDGELTGVYALELGEDPLTAIFDSRNVVVSTVKSQHIVPCLRKEGIID